MDGAVKSSHVRMNGQIFVFFNSFKNKQKNY